MPTLMTTTVESTEKDISLAEPSSLFCPPALTLSIGGVDFTLSPSNNDGVVSYRYDNQGGVCIDLDSFTGSLRVAVTRFHDVSPSNKTRPTTMVEEEPNSPNVAKDVTTDVSPGQKRLPFPKVMKGAGKKATSKSNTISIKKKLNGANQNKSRKRETANFTAEPVKPKKSKIMEASSDLKSEPPQLFQQSPPELAGSTYTQETHCPDLSQTMDSSSNPSSTVGGEDKDSAQKLTVTSGDDDKERESVQEILDRVNNSSDSVATVPNDDNSAIESIKSEHKSDVTSGDDDKQPSTAAFNVEDEKIRAQPDPTQTLEEGDNKNEVQVDEASSFKGFKPPIPRWGHTMTKIKGDQILIFGGQSFDKDGNPTMLDDVHVYDSTKGQWDKPINCTDIPRQWHTANFLPERQLLITFGGETLDPVKKKVVTTDSLRVLDCDIYLWYPPAVSGSIPAARSGHSSTLIPNSQELVVFGGVKGSKWLNTVSVLDTVRWIWSSPKIEGSAPKPRSYHSAVAVKAKDADWYKLVIFGGNSKSSCFNSIHVLEMQRNNWCWKHPTVSGVAPFPRTGSCATLMEDGKTICVYGGWDPNEEDEEENMFKGSYLLDTETWVWRTGPKPVFAGSGCEFPVDDCGSKRAGHTSVLDGGNVLVFGGRTPGERLAGDFQTLSSSEKFVGLDG